MSIARAQREIDSVEFAYWMAYYNIEPFGERVADIRMGMIASTMANIHRDPKKAAFEPSDFIPWAKPPAQPVLFDDPKDQACLVAMEVFGIDLTKSKGKKFRIKRKAHG